MPTNYQGQNVGNTDVDAMYAAQYGPADPGAAPSPQVDANNRLAAAQAKFNELVAAGVPPAQARDQSGIMEAQAAVDAVNAGNPNGAPLPNNRTDAIMNSRQFQGTSYDQYTLNGQGEYQYLGGPDDRSYMYGRSPTGADEAVNRAWTTGQGAADVGAQMYQQGMQQAAVAQARGPYQANFGQQNAALGQTMGYADRLAGLEATQGPSAAQAQLQQGTNQALNSQLALARSGRGFGANAANMGLAQGNIAGIQANAANESATIRAQEDAMWRQRQAGNLGAAAGITQGVGGQYGQQAGLQQQGYYQNQGQNDAAALGWAGQGQGSYFQGVNANLNSQTLGNSIRGQQMTGDLASEDNYLRWLADKHGREMAAQQRNDQQQAAYIQMGASALGQGASLYGQYLQNQKQGGA